VTIVVDANVIFEVIVGSGGGAVFANDQAVAPPLLWPELRSALHVARWRGVLTAEDAQSAFTVWGSISLQERRHRRLGPETWRIADELGWSKTYDAEYLALASLMGVPLVSFDRRVLRAAERLGIDTHDFV
jgi:predicted nucleic acid-binding protein